MSVASASTDLSEAIKDVTIGGYLRYRYTEDKKHYQTPTVSDANEYINDNNEYKAVLNMDIKASDTITAHGRLVWKDSFDSNNNAGAQEGANPFNVREAYLKYSKDALTVKAGFQALATPLTDHDDDYANGILATDTFAGVTVAGGYFNQISNAGGQALSNNVYVLATIADIKPVKVQAWYYNVSSSKTIDLDDRDANWNPKGNDGYYAYFLEAALNAGPVAVKMQYVGAKGTDSVEYDSNTASDKTTKAKNQRFFAIAATGKVDVASVTAAYLKFGHDGSDVTVGTKNADQLIAAGDILTDTIQQDGGPKDGAAVALVASAKVMDKTTVGCQWVKGTSHDVEDAQTTTFAEYDLDVAYQYNKKLKFSGYYAILNTTVGSDATATGGDGTTRETQARFEAKYSF